MAINPDNGNQAEHRWALEQERARLKEKIGKLESELERLKDQYVRYYDLVELAVDAILMGDSHGIIYGVNQSAVEMTGYPREELIGMSISQLFSEEERKRAPLRYDLLRQGQTIQNERLLLRRDGTTVPIEMNSRMMPDSTYHTFIRDISRRLEIEGELEETEMMQRALTDATFEAIFLSSNGVCLGQNRKAEELFGYSAEEAVGKKIGEWVDPEKRKETLALAFSGTESPYETIALRKDGSTFPAEVQGRNIVFRGEKSRVTALRDITERKQAERNARTLQKLEGLGTLAGGIAHDFNNLLTGLYGSLSLSKLHLEKSHPVYGLIEQAESSLERATHLTQKLLTFAKGGAPVREQVDLGELVVDTVSFDLSGSNVKFLFDQDDDLWTADVDKAQIQQAFSNLTINADQAMPEGGHLSIRLENYSSPEGAQSAPASGKYIRATVQDDGEGIREEHLGRIFDPYFSTKQTGRGLGLATVFSIVNKHSGSINVTSRRGRGTTFTLFLPALTEDRREDGLRLEDQERVVDISARTLVMDDDPVILKILEEMLKIMGCDVDTVPDGRQAMSRFTEAFSSPHPYDLVILDLTIPGGAGGKETIRRIHDVDPAVKVIVSSGYAEDPVMARHEEYGFAGVVTKPYIFEQLQEEILRVLGR